MGVNCEHLQFAFAHFSHTFSSPSPFIHPINMIINKTKFGLFESACHYVYPRSAKCERSFYEPLEPHPRDLLSCHLVRCACLFVCSAHPRASSLARTRCLHCCHSFFSCLVMIRSLCSMHTLARSAVARMSP